MQNKQDLKDIWKDLLSDHGEGEFYVERTINISPLEIKLRIQKPLDKYSIVILSDNTNFSNLGVLTKNKYFRVKRSYN